MSDELPSGWATAPVRALFDCWGGMTPSTSIDAYWGGMMPWVSSKDVKARFVDGGTECVTTKALTETRLRTCQPGTVLVVVRSGVLAHTLPVGIATRELVVNQDVKALDSGNAQLNEWLSLYLRAHERDVLEANRKDGTTVQSIRVEELLDRSMPVAPLAEQRRIVEKVEALLDQVNRAKARLDCAPLILKRFRQAVLAAACSGRLTEEWRAKNPDISPVSRVLEHARRSPAAAVRRAVPDVVGVPDDLAGLELPATWALASTASLLRAGVLIDVKDGNHGANHPKVAEFTARGLPFITAAQVTNYRISYETAPKVSGEPLKRLRVGFAKPGDAILTHKGSVGRAAVNAQECVLTPQTTYYRCDPHVIDARYLVYYFTSFHFFSQLAAVMSQTTRDFVPISEQYRLFVILPPLAEQLEVVRRVDELFALADAVSGRVDTATARAGKLPEAILGKAFSGELVPTEAELARAEGREYETAARLLKRVRREVEREPAVPGRRTARTPRRRAERASARLTRRQHAADSLSRS